MSTDRSQEQPTFSSEVYLLALGYLPSDYENRWKIATVAGWMAVYGDNISKLARAMDCSRDFARELVKEAKRVLQPVAEEFMG